MIVVGAMPYCRLSGKSQHEIGFIVSTLHLVMRNAQATANPRKVCHEIPVARADFPQAIC